MLAGCHFSAEDKSYFLKHPQQLTQALSQCRLSLADDQRCRLVQSVGQQVQQLVQRWQADPADFGMQIMHMQKVLVDLRAAQAKEANESERFVQIDTQMQRQQANIELHYAVIRLLMMGQLA